MKNLIHLLVMTGLLLIPVPAYAISSCENSPVAQNWIIERDRYALKMVKEWMAGKPKEALAPLIGLIWANETKTTAECRKEPDFLKRNLIFYGETPFPLTVDTIPPMILRWLLKDDSLSPELSYKQMNGEGGAKWE